ncbi:hypothetical protein H4R19_005562 [Coemansia spiralis]|nr:hypothetical protein H4R19_005562 [Coemansia spiralis]
MSALRATGTAGPGRCESPLLPMGQHPTHQTDPDRLSQQTERTSHRQSQQSVLLDKTYAIPDDRDSEPPPAAAPGASRTRCHIHRPHRLPRATSHRIALPTRDLSSRLKSACRKLDPRRLATANAPPSPPLPTDASSA